MKKVFVIFFVLLSFGMVLQLQADTLDVKNKVYIIKEGDCLWNIAQTFYNNPFLWTNIWERNPYIKNPDLIFPNDELVLPNISETTEAVENEMVKKGTPTEVKEEPKAKVTEEAPVEEVISEETETPKSIVKDMDIPINYDEFVLRAGGIVNGDEITEAGYISGFENSYNALHAENEIAYLKLYSQEVAAGDNFIIYTIVGKVKNPETKSIQGEKLKIKGLLTIVEMGENSIKGNIKKAYDNIGKGDLLMAYNEDDWLYNPEGGVPINKEGIIVAYNADGKMIGNVQDIVYIDLGKEDGIKQGQKFYLIRSSKKYKDPVSGQAYTDDDKVGIIKIIKVFDYSASAIIMKLSEELGVGTPVKYMGE
ncbi:LysM peptidoglycan-binding domain-containing protein [bacterium]|nr:LysM peptidoglycan-binding domain-containing protein [bacterium]